MPRKREPLEIQLLRSGELDVDLHTGEVFSVRHGVHITPRKTRPDKDGYSVFDLHRERCQRTGRPEKQGPRGVVRFRERRFVRVNRLVKIKAMAVAKGGRNWRAFVCELPAGVEVNHIGERSDNRNDMLELQTETANSARRESTAEEYAELQAIGW